MGNKVLRNIRDLHPRKIYSLCTSQNLSRVKLPSPTANFDPIFSFNTRIKDLIDCKSLTKYQVATRKQPTTFPNFFPLTPLLSVKPKQIHSYHKIIVLSEAYIGKLNSLQFFNHWLRSNCYLNIGLKLIKNASSSHNFNLR